MIATRDELRLYLHTAGTVSVVTPGGAGSVDDRLLDLFLRAADKRLKNARPERTLEAEPSLRDDGTPEEPSMVDDREPIARTFAAGRVTQVPDLREVTKIEVDGREYTGGHALRRRHPSHPALWLVLRQAPLYADELVVTGRWGPAESDTLEPSDDVKSACLGMAARAYYNRQARHADRVQDPAGGIASYFRQMPPDVQAVVDALQVPGA